MRRSASPPRTGVLVPGGFGGRGVEGMVLAAQYARERGVPYLGLCLGMQVAVIEYARHVLGWADADSGEFAPGSAHKVIDFMPGQSDEVGQGRHAAPGRVALRDIPGHGAGALLRRAGDKRAAPPPLRAQQRLPRRAGGGGAVGVRPLAGRPPGRGGGGERPPLLHRRAVPPGVQEPARPPAPRSSSLFARGCARGGED